MSSQARDRVSDFVLGEFEEPRRPQPEQEEPSAYHPDQFELLNLGRPQEDPREVAQRQARQILAEADEKVQQARQNIDEAQSESEAIRQKAYEEGYQQGLDEGKVASLARIEAAMSNIETAVASLDRAKHNVLGNLEREVIALVQAAVDGLFLVDNALPGRLVGGVVRRAIEQVVASGVVTVRCSGVDIDAINELQPQLLQRFGMLERVNVISDEELGPGDCMVEAADTVIDATLATRRKAIFEQLEQSLRNGPALDVDELAATEPGPRAPESEAEPQADSQADDGWGDAPADDPEQW